MTYSPAEEAPADIKQLETEASTGSAYLCSQSVTVLCPLLVLTGERCRRLRMLATRLLNCAETARARCSRSLRTTCSVISLRLSQLLGVEKLSISTAHRARLKLSPVSQACPLSSAVQQQSYLQSGACLNETLCIWVLLRMLVGLKSRQGWSQYARSSRCRSARQLAKSQDKSHTGAILCLTPQYMSNTWQSPTLHSPRLIEQEELQMQVCIRRLGRSVTHDLPLCHCRARLEEALLRLDRVVGAMQQDKADCLPPSDMASAAATQEATGKDALVTRQQAATRLSEAYATWHST